MKREFMLMLLSILCSISSMAQTDSYYYYRGTKIPLTLNEDKICVSIAKEHDMVSERIRANVQVLRTIENNAIDLFVISRSDFENLTSQEFWVEDAKSVILSSCYFTENYEEVATSPYLNVKLKNEEDQDLLTSYAEQYKLRIVGNDPYLPLWYILAVTNDCDKDVLECVNSLWESGDFAASEPDLCTKNLTCSNDPLYNQQWGLHNSHHPNIDISVSSAWNYATGRNIKIAIIDTGVDTTHVDLESNIGLRYNTETGSSSYQINYQDNYAHGTHCAGIAAAVKDNNIHIAGVAPDAKIISISNTLKGTTNSRLKRADGIIWAYQHGADIISNSWISSTYHAAIDEAIHEAFRYGRQGKGCVIVFATGNGYDSNIDYPACSNDTILAVGAIRHDGIRADFSNYGAGLDILAPGFNIYSTFPGNRTLVDSGTSMACPHVAGVAALILERNSELTVSQVNSIICSNAKKVQGINFNVTKPDGLWNEEYGYGLVDAYSSVINTPTTAYIQNETITGIRVISAERIYVGRNVTNTKEYGDVGLGPGDITMKAKCTVIKNSTTVPVGTKLKIGS